MSTQPIVFGVGLPRSAGQTLQDVLSIITGRQVWHSIGANWDQFDEEQSAGAVECFAPIRWFEDNFHEPYYIINQRHPESWLASCSRVYHKSGEWNHPMWKYPLEQFPAYYEDYYATMEMSFSFLAVPPERRLYWDITQQPDWSFPCGFLGVPEPEHLFPDRDRVGRDVVSHENSGEGNVENFFPSPWSRRFS